MLPKDRKKKITDAVGNYLSNSVILKKGLESSYDMAERVLSKYGLKVTPRTVRNHLNQKS